MKHKYLEKRYTILGWLNFMLASMFVAFFVASISVLFFGAAGQGRSAAVYVFGSVGLILAAVLAYIVYRYIRESRLLKNRVHAINHLAAQNGWQTLGSLPDSLKYSSLLHIADRDRRFIHGIKGPEWECTDLSYAVYEKTRYGEYRSATIYYAVMNTALPRKLPNVVFDSLRQRGRQFKAVFDSKQLHRLEGGFDKHFQTYFAGDYTIDSLSFISPDVMEALVAASDYDVEIIGDQLMLYGPMYAPEQQIPEMSRKLAVIKKQLLDNILTYRDERLPYSDGRKTVAPQGMFLKRRKVSIWTTVAIIALYIILKLLDAGFGS